jgi:hypothetical protein
MCCIGCLGVGTRAPALVPCVFNLTTIALGGAAVFDAVCGLKGHAVLLGLLGAQGDAFCGFFVQLLRHGRRAACGADAFDHNRLGDVALANSQRVAHLHFARRFDILAVDLHAVFGDFITRKAACFIKASSPEPLVDAQAVHV